MCPPEKNEESRSAKRFFSLRHNLALGTYVTVLIALLISTTAIGLIGVAKNYDRVINNTLVTAKTISIGVRPALLSKNREYAVELLQALSASKDVERAAIYDVDGILFAEYAAVDPSRPAIPPLLADGESNREGNHLLVSYDIKIRNQKLGTISLDRSLSGFIEKLGNFALIILIVVAISIGMVVPIWARLQKVIVTPLDDLINTLRYVTRKKDFSVRAKVFNEDEIANLVRGINHLLATIEKRNEELRKYTVDLEDEVGKRTVELRIVNNRLSEELAEKEKIEADLRENASMLKGLSDAALEGVMIHDNGLILEANEMLVQIFGYDTKTVIGKSLLTFLTPESAERVVMHMTQNLQSAYEVTGYKGDGTKIHLEVRGVDVIRKQKKVRVAAIRDITDRKEAEALLVSAKQESDRANRAKSEFLSTVSHEIRTPLNAIVGMARILQKTDLDEEQHEYLNLFKKSGETLLVLVNDLLDMSKIESGRLDMESVSFDLPDMIENICTVLGVTSIDKGVELICDIDEGVSSTLKGDPVRLRQVLINLIGNAIKFTNKGYVLVEVSVARKTLSGVLLRFLVKDTGIGIEKKNLEKIFESFTQADSSTTRKYGGSGLGLSIAREIVRRMDGDISIESRPGEGSSFSFSARFDLPPDVRPVPTVTLGGIKSLLVLQNQCLSRIVEKWLFSARAQTRSAPDISSAMQIDEKTDLLVIEPAQDVGKKNIKTVIEKLRPSVTLLFLNPGEKSWHDIKVDGCVIEPLFKPVSKKRFMACLKRYSGNSKSNTLTPVQKVEEKKNNSGRKFDFLLVEDNEINAKLVTVLLEDRGQRVNVACNGKEAVGKISSGEKFDIIFMDILMPEMDGMTATKLLRKMGLKTPIIAMTALAYGDEQKKCIAAGMNDVIYKPIDETIMWQVVGKYLPDWNYEEANQLLLPVLVEEEKNVKHFDLQKALTRVMGNKNFLKSVAKIFLETYQNKLTNIEKMLKIKDLTGAEIAVHSIKSEFGLLGADIATQKAQQLENILSGKKSAHSLEETVTQLRQEIDQLVPSLHSFLEN